MLATCLALVAWCSSEPVEGRQRTLAAPTECDQPTGAANWAGAGGRALLQQSASPATSSSSSSSSSMLTQPFVFTWRTTLMMAVCFAFSALAMAAGVGGGLIFTPLNNVLLQFSE